MVGGHIAENWISLRAYSRHRDCALSAVQKAIASIRITAVKRDENGRVIAVDQIAADRQWANNTDPVEAARSGASILPPNSPEQPEDEGGTDGGDQHDYLKHRAREKESQALLAQLEYAKAIGSVVNAQDVRESGSRR